MQHQGNPQGLEALPCTRMGDPPPLQHGGDPPLPALSPTAHRANYHNCREVTKAAYAHCPTLSIEQLLSENRPIRRFAATVKNHCGNGILARAAA